MLDFLFKGIALCRRSDCKGSPSDNLMHALDRTILYLLSRPIDSVQGKSSIHCFNCNWNIFYFGIFLIFFFKCFVQFHSYISKIYFLYLICNLQWLTFKNNHNHILIILVQMSILDTLSEIIENRAIVLSPMHNDPLFFGPLTHLLFMLSVTPDILSKNDYPNLDHGSAQVIIFIISSS